MTVEPRVSSTRWSRAPLALALLALALACRNQVKSTAQTPSIEQPAASETSESSAPAGPAPGADAPGDTAAPAVEPSLTISAALERHAEGLALTASWPPVAGVTSYSLIVAWDAACTDVIVRVDGLRSETSELTVTAAAETVHVCLLAFTASGASLIAVNNGIEVSIAGPTAPTPTPPSPSPSPVTPGDGAAPAQASWSFDVAGDYTFDASKVSVSGNQATLRAVDQRDDDDDALGFGGGTHGGTSWSAGGGYLAADVAVPMAASDVTYGALDMTPTRLLLHFDETTAPVVDASGLGHTVTASPSLQQTGRFGFAGGFDGTAGVVIDDAADLRLGGTMTVTAWIKTTDTTHDLEIMSKGGSTPNWEWVLVKHGHGVRFAPGQCSGSDYLLVDTTGVTVDDGEWHHVAAVSTPTRARVYVDGVLAAEDTYTSGTVCAGGTEPVRIGLWTYHNRENFVGSIDEVMLSAAALTAAEVEALYRAQRVGRFRSRILDAGRAATWSDLAWTPSRPYLKNLPNDRQTETLYAAGSADMATNELLLHFDDATLADGATAADRSGNARSATVHTGAGDRSTATKLGRGLALDGSTYAEIPSSAAWDTLLAGDFTVCAWFQLSTLSGTFPIFFRGGATSRTFFDVEDGMLALGSKLANGTYSNRYLANAVTAASRWYHGCAVYAPDAATLQEQIRLYLDGAELTSALGSWNGPLASETTPIRIGYSTNDATPQYGNGAVDELAVWHAALPPAAVRDLFLRGRTSQLLELRVRACAQSDCSDATFAGPGGDAGAFFSEALNASPGLPSVASLGLPARRYFQYEVVLDVGDALDQPRLSKVEVGVPHYPAGDPTIVNASGPSFSRLVDFSATMSPVDGVTFQISRNGTDWYYVDGAGHWAAASSSAEASTASAVSAHAATFATEVGAGTFRYRAFLTSPASDQTATLSRVTVTYAP